MTHAIRTLLLATTLLLSPLARADCEVVYGSDWAFASRTPEHWLSACGPDALPGTNLIAWPGTRTLGNTDAALYVTVFRKENPSFQSFIAGEQTALRRDAPGVSITPIKIPALKKMSYRIFRMEGIPGGKHELVAYAEGPGAYYLIVLTNDSEELLNRYRPAFVQFLLDFTALGRRRP